MAFAAPSDICSMQLISTEPRPKGEGLDSVSTTLQPGLLCLILEEPSGVLTLYPNL